MYQKKLTTQTMKKAVPLFLVLLSCLIAFVQCYGGIGFDPLGKFMKDQRSQGDHARYDATVLNAGDPIVYVMPQDGSKEGDRIETLPGQPTEVNLNQYSGYVTVDPTAGRAFFYYFVEAVTDPTTKPLVLWLNGGPGCSSFGNGAMMELGPFRVTSDNKTLSHNEYAWNNLANILFLESPAGVGFSYSNTSSDYDLNGDQHTAQDSYTFLVNWLERFPEFKTRDFFITGESYAGHYVPQLAQTILHYNKVSNQTSINLKGIAIGNAWIDFETGNKGMYDFFWTHSFISDEVNEGINSNCNFTSYDTISGPCEDYLDLADDYTEDLFIYDVYAPLCNKSNPASPSISGFDPCTNQYIETYLNTPEVQNSLHVVGVPHLWQSCNDSVLYNWKDSPLTVLHTIKELMGSGISVWIYSGDTDGRVPTTSTRSSIDKLKTPVKTAWYPWYTRGEVGGYAVGYENLSFVTVRGAGHFVPSYQPARGLILLSSFLEGKLPPPYEG